MALTPLLISARAILTGTGRVSTPVARAGSATDERMVDNPLATTAPGPSNDNTEGYHQGSRWFNGNTGELYQCRSAATGAAVWVKTRGSNQIAGNWYRARLNAGSNGTAPGVNLITLAPLMDIHKRLTISGFNVRMNVTAVGNFQVALYANNPSTMRPTGSALASTASISSNTSGNITCNLSSSYQVDPTHEISYWVAMNTDAATAAWRALLSTGPSAYGSLIGSTAPGSIFVSQTGGVTGLTTPQTFGTWPSLTGATFTEVSTLIIPDYAYLVASVP